MLAASQTQDIPSRVVSTPSSNKPKPHRVHLIMPSGPSQHPPTNAAITSLDSGTETTAAAQPLSKPSSTCFPNNTSTLSEESDREDSITGTGTGITPKRKDISDTDTALELIDDGTDEDNCNVSIIGMSCFLTLDTLI